MKSSEACSPFLYKEFNKNCWELNIIPILVNSHVAYQIHDLGIKHKYDLYSLSYSFPYVEKQITTEGRIVYKASSVVFYHGKEVDRIDIEAEELF